VTLPPVNSVLPQLLSSKEGFDYFAQTVFNKPISARHPSYNVVPRIPAPAGSGATTAAPHHHHHQHGLSPGAALVRRLALQSALSAERVESDEERDDFYSNEGGHASQYYKDLRASIGRIRRTPRALVAPLVQPQASEGTQPPQQQETEDDAAAEDEDGDDDDTGGGGHGGFDEDRSARLSAKNSAKKLALSQLSVRARGLSAAHIRRRLAAASKAMPPPLSHQQHQQQHHLLHNRTGIAGAGSASHAPGLGYGYGSGSMTARRPAGRSLAGSSSGFATERGGGGGGLAYPHSAAPSGYGGAHYSAGGARVLRDWPMVDVPYDSRGRDERAEGEDYAR